MLPCRCCTSTAHGGSGSALTARREPLWHARKRAGCRSISPSGGRHVARGTWHCCLWHGVRAWRARGARCAHRASPITHHPYCILPQYCTEPQNKINTKYIKLGKSNLELGAFRNLEVTCWALAAGRPPPDALGVGRAWRRAAGGAWASLRKATRCITRTPKARF